MLLKHVHSKTSAEQNKVGKELGNPEIWIIIKKNIKNY